MSKKFNANSLVGETMKGKKIDNLQLLKDKGFNVPDFLVADKSTDIKESDIPWELCAVRSSSQAEDSMSNSFAGQFDTYLNVPKSDVCEKIKECFESVNNENVKEYAIQNDISIENMQMHVMVQKMIKSEYSGVCFSANPQGILNEMVIVVGKGTGDGVVEDKIQTTSYYYNCTDKVYYYEGKEDYLSNSMIEEIIATVTKIKAVLGEYLDIEFAIENGKLYILQARPITTINADNPLILDNSNIVESYPGLSLPLTCSFVNIVYSGIFKSISRRVLKNEKELAKHEDVFLNMVGNANGRIYYKISNWYTVIKFLPMNEKIIPVWQDMMGVKIKSYDTNKVELSKLMRAKTYINVISEMLHVSRNMEKLSKDFVRINNNFYEKYNDKITAKELVKLYHELHDTLLSCWDVTLLNDVYAFIFTGMIKKRLGNDSNQVISGISNIESLKPVREMIKLAYEKNNMSQSEYEKRFNEYIQIYGDRNLEELKLESKTFRSKPELLTQKLEEYNEDFEKLSDMYKKLSDEPTQENKLKGINKFLAKKAAKGIANRELSRLNRSRIFGIVRLIFSKIGEEFFEKGIINESKDIFWLTVDEVFSYVENEPQDKQSIKDMIEGRKNKYQVFENIPAYQRLIFAQKEFDKVHNSVNSNQIYVSQDKLLGTPCSDGIVEGEALVITDVTKAVDYKNKILVTKMTDPGWVFLLVGAKGVISEKGSLLSHTAIISRELKIPSVVGVENLMRTVKTGDKIRMNGATGEVVVL